MTFRVSMIFELSVRGKIFCHFHRQFLSSEPSTYLSFIWCPCKVEFTFVKLSCQPSKKNGPKITWGKTRNLTADCQLSLKLQKHIQMTMFKRGQSDKQTHENAVVFNFKYFCFKSHSVTFWLWAVYERKQESIQYLCMLILRYERMYVSLSSLSQKLILIYGQLV